MALISYGICPATIKGLSWKLHTVQTHAVSNEGEGRHRNHKRSAMSACWKTLAYNRAAPERRYRRSAMPGRFPQSFSIKKGKQRFVLTLIILGLTSAQNTTRLGMRKQCGSSVSDCAAAK